VEKRDKEHIAARVEELHHELDAEISGGFAVISFGKLALRAALKHA
jgi:hypothetical protein